MRERAIVAAVYGTVALALSGQWIAAKIGVNAVPPLELSTMRFATASVALVAVAVATRTPLPLHRWRIAAATAAFGVLGFNTLAFLGQRMTPATDTALILPTTIPVATALLATLIRERLTTRKLLGFAVATAGAAAVIFGAQTAEAGGSASRLLGDLLEVGSAVSWGAALTIAAIAMRRENVLGFVTLVIVFGTVMILPLPVFEAAYRDLPAWPMQAWTAAAFLGLVSTAIAFPLFFWAVRRFGAGLGALVSYLVPPAALVLAFVVLGERPLPLQIVGAATILIGVRLAASRAAPVAQQKAA